MPIAFFFAIEQGGHGDAEFCLEAAGAGVVVLRDGDDGERACGDPFEKRQSHLADGATDFIKGQKNGAARKKVD
jgi:hypothetical protein